MGRGRPPERKCSEKQFKNYILEYSVTDDGKKRPVRDMLALDEFMDKTGYFRINKYTKKREPKREGSLSYWTGIKKFNISERDIFDYHQRETFRIRPEISFDEWTRKNNKNSNKKRKFSLKDYDDLDKVKKAVNKILKEVNYEVLLTEYSDEFKIRAIWDTLITDRRYIGQKNKFINKFKKYYSGGE